VTARLREDVSPRTTGQQLLDFALITGRYLRESPITAVVDLLPHPREVREGQAPHGRHGRPRAGRSRFPLCREEDALHDGRRVQDRDRGGELLDVLRSASGSYGRLRPPYCLRSS